METSNTNLTDQEILFCDLFAHGEAPFGGNAARCYQEVFNDTSKRTKSRAAHLLARPEIQEYLKSLDELTYEEAKYMILKCNRSVYGRITFEDCFNDFCNVNRI